MPKCDYCGSTILFGGVADGDFRFCNNNCQANGAHLELVKRIPEEKIEEHIEEVRESECPRCGGPGPIDLHTSHRAMSFLVLTQWSSHPQVCCVKCGRNAKIKDTLLTAAIGWWGFPWGVIMSPIQIGRNLFGLMGSHGKHEASPEMRKVVAVQLASQLAERRAAKSQQSAKAKKRQAGSGSHDHDELEVVDE